MSRSTRTKVVFFPYQASMWDCLASIWQAAVQDPQCDVMVVPLPYRSPGDHTYVTDEFPEHLAPVDWREIDLRRLRADIAYIHNAYDQANLVTQVHPSFQSPALASAAELLIYVPYYVIAGDLPPHHDLLPAYSHVDVIVAQSQRVADHVDASVRHKCVPLGNPKTDHVQRISARDRELGARRSIFINNSIASVLEQGIGAIELVQRVIEAAERRLDVDLVWRPHPLLQSTLEHLPAEFGQAFNAAQQAVADSPVARLDTSPTLDHVFSQCDAYIGEATSSVLHLWNITGRPALLFIASPACGDSAEIVQTPWIADACAGSDSDHLYFVHNHLDALCEMDLRTGVARVLRQLGEHNARFLPYRSIRQLNGQLVLSPGLSTELVTLAQDPETWREKTRMPLGPGHANVFGLLHQWRDRLVLAPGRFPEIYLIDAEGAVETWSEWIDELDLTPAMVARMTTGRASAVVGDTLYLACTTVNSVFALNLETRQIITQRVGENNVGFVALTVHDGIVWLASRTEALFYSWDPLSGAVREVRDFPDEFEPGPVPFRELVSTDDGIFAFPDHGNAIIHLDPTSGVLSIVDVLPTPDARTRLRPIYSSPSNFVCVAQLGDGSVIAQNAYDGSVIRLRSREDWYRIMPRFDPVPTLESAPLADQFGNQGSHIPWGLQEDGLAVTLDKFLAYVAAGDHDERAQCEAYEEALGPLDGQVGERIHEFAMQRLSSGPGPGLASLRQETATGDA